MSQREEDLIHACESALLFYGGTPAVIVPDNLKSAVNKPSRYEAELNEDFAAFAEHYGSQTKRQGSRGRGGQARLPGYLHPA